MSSCAVSPLTIRAASRKMCRTVDDYDKEMTRQEFEDNKDDWLCHIRREEP